MLSKKSFDELDKVPSNDVALVLGTVKELNNGRPNLYFIFRIDAAAELYHAER